MSTVMRPADDVVSDVLDSLRLRGEVFCRNAFAAPWGLSLPQRGDMYFHVVERGNAWVTCGNAPPLRLGSGDVVMIAQGAPHCIGDRLDSLTVPLDLFLLERGERGSVAVNADALLLCGTLTMDVDDVHSMVTVLPPMLRIAAGEAGGIDALVSLIVAEASSDVVGAPAVLRRLSETLFVQALRSYLRGDPEIPPGWLAALRDPMTSRAVRAMHRSPTLAWTVDALAREAGASRSSFAARFARAAGLPPLAYLARWRMRLASRLLRDTDTTVREVAERVGYVSEASFHRAFRARFGAAPGRWRRGTAA